MASPADSALGSTSRPSPSVAANIEPLGCEHAGPPAVRAEALAKVYPNGTVGLRGLDLTIQPGEFVGVLGRSGSGKTTLFRLLTGTLRPTAGRLAVLGVEMAGVRGGELQRLRRRLAWVAQQHNLVTGLSVAQNVLLGRLAAQPLWRAAGWLFYPPAAERRAAHAALAQVELADRLWQRADDLSGGQQQRVAVARALASAPELLIADEPVASVDPRTASIIVEQFRRLNADHGATVLVSLHQTDLALTLCPRIIVLRAGGVIYDGPPSGIAPADLFREAGEGEGEGDATGAAPAAGEASEGVAIGAC